MSDIEKQDDETKKNLLINESKLMESLFEKTELFAVNAAMQNTPKFSESQVDSLITGMQDSEKRLYDYNTAILANDHELNKKDHHLKMYLLLAIVLLTLSILFFKDTYLDKWLSFIIGIAGGTGISKLFERNPKSNKE